MEGEGPTRPSATRVAVARGLTEVGREWEELAERANASPFLRPGWIRAWSAAFGRGVAETLLARRGDELVGVLPLQRHRGVLSSPTNWHTPEFAPLAADQEAGRALIAAAAGRCRRRLDLAFLPHSGVAEGLLGGSGKGDGRLLIRTIERSPWVAIEGSWEDYESGLPGKRRADLRRRLRRLEEEVGEVEFASHAAAEGLGPLLEEGFAIEAAGWKGKRGTAIREDPGARSFYGSVAAWAAASGALSLWFLRAGGRGIAFAFCLVDGCAHHVLKTGFDPAYSRYSPGLLLTREMLRNAFERGLKRYEFLGQADPYKLIWTDRLHERERLQLFPPGPLGAVESLAWRRGRPLVQSLLRR